MRTNKVILIAGTRNTGKTDFSKEMMMNFGRSNFDKVLVVDTFDSDTWETMETHAHPEWMNIEVPILAVEKFPQWKKGLARMFSSDISGIMKTISTNARNTFIVFEDAKKYIKSRLSEDLERFILDSKQKNLDLVFVFHALMQIPPDLVRVADVLVIFKTNESSKVGEKYPQPEIPEIMKKVKESTNRYEHIAISLN